MERLFIILANTDTNTVKALVQMFNLHIEKTKVVEENKYSMTQKLLAHPVIGAHVYDAIVTNLRQADSSRLINEHLGEDLGRKVFNTFNLGNIPEEQPITETPTAEKPSSEHPSSPPVPASTAASVTPKVEETMFQQLEKMFIRLGDANTKIIDFPFTDKPVHDTKTFATLRQYAKNINDDAKQLLENNRESMKFDLEILHDQKNKDFVFTMYLLARHAWNKNFEQLKKKLPNNTFFNETMLKDVCTKPPKTHKDANVTLGKCKTSWTSEENDKCEKDSWLPGCLPSQHCCETKEAAVHRKAHVDKAKGTTSKTADVSTATKKDGSTSTSTRPKTTENPGGVETWIYVVIALAVLVVFAVLAYCFFKGKKADDQRVAPTASPERPSAQEEEEEETLMEESYESEQPASAPQSGEKSARTQSVSQRVSGVSGSGAGEASKNVSAVPSQSAAPEEASAMPASAAPESAAVSPSHPSAAAAEDAEEVPEDEATPEEAGGDEEDVGENEEVPEEADEANDEEVADGDGEAEPEAAEEEAPAEEEE